jgi:tetratricopeptide (TPR) repeat protein
MTSKVSATMQLKPITPEGIPAALQKAERYRLLNDSSAAESICLDVLEIEPTNQTAIVFLLLSITDQFSEELADGVSRAREVLPRLTDEYERTYYAGIIAERRARAQLHRGTLGAAEVAADGFREAMHWYEKAERMRPAGNDESILRWNTCARMLGRHERAHVEREYEPALDD